MNLYCPSFFITHLATEFLEWYSTRTFFLLFQRTQSHCQAIQSELRSKNYSQILSLHIHSRSQLRHLHLICLRISGLPSQSVCQPRVTSNPSSSRMRQQPAPSRSVKTTGLQS